MKHTIEKIFINDTDAQGKQYVTKNGDLYKKVKIKLSDGRYASKLCYAINDPELAWRDGEEHDIELIEKNGFLNFVSHEVNSTPVSQQPAQQVKSENARKLDDILGGQGDLFMEIKELREKVDEILRIINLK